MAARKKKKSISKKVNLNRSTTDDASIPESNVINLREVMLQREVEKLRKELEKKQRSSGIGKVKDWISSASNKPPESLERIEIPQPGEKTEFVQPIASKKKRPSLKVKFSRPQIKVEQAHVKSLMVFISICLLLVLPIFGLWGYQYLSDLRGRIVDVSMDAFDQLILAGEAATENNFDIAQQKFSEASDTFILAQKELDKMGGIMFNLLRYAPFKGKVLTSGQHLLEAGQAISLAGQDITEVVEIFNPQVANSDNFLVQNSLTGLLNSSQDYLVPAQERIRQAVDHLKQVDSEALPVEYRDDIDNVKASLPLLEANFEQFITFSDLFYTLLGGDVSKRYLLIFQNNREMRATGGFIGSIALVEVNNGEITKMEVPGGGPYDLQGQLKEKVIAPAPLHLVNPHWYLQDANWFPDFPASAQKIMWFYEKSGGPTVDGVISLTPDVIIDLLKIIGSIDLQEQYSVTITSENFIEETLNQVENEYDVEENKPKQFIADLLPIVLERVFSGNQQEFFALLGVLSEALEQRHLMFYMSDQTTQTQVDQLDWGGEIKQSSGDYLMVVNTNISGGKTDAVIDQTINHKVEIQPNGEAITTVEITRLHNGQIDDQWTGSKNIDFMRLYAPQGSELIEATGFESPDPKLMQWPEPGYEVDSDLSDIEGQVIIDERTNTRINNEFGKTVFGNWVQVEPGESVTATITYKLPFTVTTGGFINTSTPYSLYVQKQSGSFDSVFHSEIDFPEDYSIIWQWPDQSELVQDGNSLKLEKVLKSDMYFGVVFQK